MQDNDLKRLVDRLEAKLVDSFTRPLPIATPRRLRGRLQLPQKATAVIGMRRAGKTTFLHQLRRERHERGAAREQLPYINFEDEQLIGLKARQLGLVVESLYRRYPALRGQATITWCFDEVQVVAGWERFVRRLLDEEQVEVFVSGSSAALLSREIATSLRGRSWEVVVHPFSFAESLHHLGLEIPAEPGLLSSVQRSHLERAFLDHLEVGGFPEAQGLDLDTRDRLLRDYVDVVMMRDVIERHRVTNVVVLHSLVRHLLGNAGSLFSIEKFHAAAKSQGLAVGRDMLHQLVSHLDDCFLVRQVWIDTTSERRRMVNPRKMYPIDTGLIPVFDRSGRANLGHALETAVLLELERRGAAVTYVRTPEGYEVDFLARTASGMELIQVCADAADAATAGRELRALEAAREQYPEAKALFLSATQAGLPASVPQGIVAKPAYEWLLGAS